MLILVISFSGCGLTGNLVDWKGDRDLDEYAAGRKKAVLELQKYIGKNSEDVRNALGEPKAVFYDGKCNNVEYEERWDYIYHKGIFLIYSEGQVSSFCFDNGKVVAVDVF